MKYPLQLRVWFFILCYLDIAKSRDSPISSNIRNVLVEHFSFTRHQAVNATAKQITRDFIIQRFKDFGFMIELNNFTTQGSAGYGQNVIGIMKGSNFGTPQDRVNGILTHYDTVRNTSGVDDNGASMSVLLEVGHVISNSRCQWKNTLIFASVDFEEYNSGYNCGDKGLCGSERFSTWWRDFQAKHYKNGNATVDGFVVMDTIMNFNDSAGSQIVPPGLDKVFPKQYGIIKGNNFKGDFLIAVGRSGVLSENKFLNRFVDDWKAQPKNTKYQVLPLPIPLITDPLQIWRSFGDLVRSDHLRLWMGNIPAIFVGATAEFRGTMQQCYHQECDNVDSITNDKIGFLKQTADTLVSVLNKGGESSCITGDAVSAMYGPHMHIITILYIGATQMIKLM